MMFDPKTPTSIIVDLMNCFLEDIEDYIRDAQHYVENDITDIFHADMIEIFSESEKEFREKFNDYLQCNRKLTQSQNKQLADQLISFVNKYKSNKDINIMYQLVGEMLETRISNIYLED